MCKIQLLSLIGHLNLNEMWLGVAPQWISKKHVFKTKLKYMLKYDSYSKLNSQHNLKGTRGGGGSMTI